MLNNKSGKLFCHAELGSASYQLGVIFVFKQDPETSSTTVQNKFINR